MKVARAIATEGNRLSTVPIPFRGDLKSLQGEHGRLALEAMLSLKQNQKRWDASLLYQFARKEWFVCGTLTWASAQKRSDTAYAEFLRSEDFKRLLYETCMALRLRNKGFSYFHVMQWGAAEECHYHFLLARHGFKHHSAEAVANTMLRLWTTKLQEPSTLNPSMGTAVIEAFDPSRQFAGTCYPLSREYDSLGRERERPYVISPRLEQELLCQLAAPNNE